MGHGICFQLFGGFHHCKHIVFAMVNLWECGVTHLLGFPIFIFQLPSSVPKRLYLLGLINHSTYFTFLDSLCNSVHSQVHPSVLSPICWWPFLMAWGFMGPLNWKYYVASPDLPSILVAQSTCWLSWFSSVAQLCGTWASMGFTFTTTFSTQTAMSFHTAVA